MEDVMKWVMENWVVVLGLVYMLLNVVNGVLLLVPGEQGEEKGGWLHTIRSWLDRISVLTNSDADGTLKTPVVSKSTKKAK